MSTRRPLQPLSPLSANIVGAKHNYLSKDGFDGLPAMEDQARDDTQALGDIASLTSLENDADDFDRLMIQNARDERRLNDALQGKVQPFRKARIHPRVGVTLENLERHNARNNTALVANAHVKFESPPSSSGSTRSDPAIQPPVGWGRKGRVRRNWMRTITSDEEQTVGAQEDTIDLLAQDERTPRANAADADVPRQSIEDSPLSHKSSRHGTPANSRQRNIDDWDFDLNEASLIASTPYLPRNTALDDIRQREIESLREQGVTRSRLDKIRESSPEERRRPRSSSAKSTASQSNGTAAPEQTTQEPSSPERRLRKRTNSWQTIGKSQAVTGEGADNSPIVVYKKSSETIGLVDRDLFVNAQSGSRRPSHKREDSQDLLRRLARVSNTPSPGRITYTRPQTAPARQPDSSSQTMVTERSPTPPLVQRPDTAPELPKESTNTEEGTTAPATSFQEARIGEEALHSQEPPLTSQDAQTEDIDATPMPVERSILNPKTPVVTGAWIDTPRPATVQRPSDRPRSRSKSPKKGSPSKPKSPEKQRTTQADDHSTTEVLETIRPTLPRSALEAIVEEARTNGQRHHGDFGDSTINSLEELLTPIADNSELDEDTLQDLQVPTGVPKNEAERQHQQDMLQIHRMNDRLRAARTSIRDTSRGIKRVENQIENLEDSVENEERVKVVYRECPCATQGGHRSDNVTIWTLFKRIFYDERLRPKRRGWALTGLSIVLIAFFTWLVLENTACEIWCHHEYASSYSGYGVTWNAPKYPYVIPTVIYRTLVKPWWRPLWAFAVWAWGTIVSCCLGTDEAQAESFTATAARTSKGFFSEGILKQWEEDGTILGMSADEVLKR